jgi:tetratricopeptide (TPR) repeat protein
MANLDYHSLIFYSKDNSSVHPLFKVPYDIYRWYSECTYNTTTEKLLALLQDFEKITKEVEASFSKDTQLFESYKIIAHITWRSYHQLQAKPLLETVIAYDDSQAETHFYLGQIYQEELKDFPKAIKHYSKFISLEPNLVPENNYFIDGWFLYHHAYEPSTIEAFTNLGDIHKSNQDYEQAKEAYIKAISLNPNHHLAPYSQLAKLLIDKEQDLIGAFKAYQKALKNYLQTKWKAYPYDRPCEYYPELEAWAKQKYPFTYHYHESGIRLFAQKFEELSDLFYQHKDPNNALACIGVSHKLLKRYQMSSSIDLYLKQIKIVFEHYKDYWQAEFLCNKVLTLDPTNKKAKEYLALVKEKLNLA